MLEKKILIKIKQKRKEIGYTQEQMAKMLGYKSKSGYNNIESGKVKINTQTLQELFQILQFNIHDVCEIFFDKQVQVSQTSTEIFKQKYI